MMQVNLAAIKEWDLGDILIYLAGVCNQREWSQVQDILKTMNDPLCSDGNGRVLLSLILRKIKETRRER